MCLNPCGHHERISRVIFLSRKGKDKSIYREFRSQNIGRHLEHHHGFGKSVAANKKEIKQQSLENSLVGAVAYQSSGYSMFEQKTFLNFYRQSCDYSKNFRENPLDSFLKLDRKNLAGKVKKRAQQMIVFVKEAVNEAIKRQKEALGTEDALETRMSVTKMADHAGFSAIRKKLGAVSMFLRHTSNGETKTFTLPLAIYDTEDKKIRLEYRGTTAQANAHHIKFTIDDFFEEDNRDFLAGCYDGGIYDKNKRQFIKILTDLGFEYDDVISFTCNTHGTALVILLRPVFKLMIVCLLLIL